jgi:hypothetical protein
MRQRTRLANPGALEPAERADRNAHARASLTHGGADLPDAGQLGLAAGGCPRIDI